MKNQNRFGKGARLLALTLSALLLLGLFPMGGALAAQTGSLTLRLQEDTYANLPRTPAVKVTLYQIGEAAPQTKAGWEIYEAFSGYGVLNAREESALGRIAARISGDIVGKEDFSGTEQTLENGQTQFANLAQGVYLGVLTGGPEGLEVDPFIVTVPSRDPKTKELRYDYPVTLKDTCVTEATVRKVWDDKDNQDGIRPKNLTVTLTSDKDVKLTDKQKTVTLIASNGWEQTITNLPMYHLGEKVTYSWVEEDLPEGYVLTNTAAEGTVTTLTNSHTPEVTSATVRKVWNDANDRDRVRPASLTVTLSTGQSVTLNAANEWTATIDNLPRFENGEEIVYTWTEGNMPEGYALTNTATNGTVTTLTNSRRPEVVSATVRKVWDDTNDQDRVRPESLTVRLSNGQRVTLNEANKWEATIDNLPKYDAGVEIAYTWAEDEMPEGYKLADSTAEGTVTTLTNSHAPDTTSATVRKMWDDDENRDGIRPVELKVSLLDGTEIVRTVTLDQSNDWIQTVENLPKYRDGKEIVYTWAENETPKGYEQVDDFLWVHNMLGDSYSDENAREYLLEQMFGPGYSAKSFAELNGPNAATLYNRHVPETVTMTVHKVWDDENDQDGVRPRSLEVALWDGENYRYNGTLDSGNDWTWSVEGLPKYRDGELIPYEWVEMDPPEDYTLINISTDGEVTTLTNRYTPEMTSATVRKVWDDANDQDGIRPESLVVWLSDGQQVELNAENNWEATVNYLPKYHQNGNEVVYTWKELSAPEGYELTNTTTEGTVTTLTNSHTPEMTSATVRKVWDDADNQDGVRPESLTVTLSTGQSVTLNAANEWTATIENLPKYREGKEIAYTWTEEGLPGGYVLTSTVTEGTVTTLNNHHTPEMTSRTVRKVWQDEENVDRIRPARLNVTLWDGLVEVGKAVLNAANNWEATIDNLPRYKDGGKEIDYYWTEEATVDYLLRQPVIEGIVTTLTNVHTPNVNLTEISGQKVWEDNHNEHKVRPANITLLLFADGAPVNAAPIWNSRTGDTWSYTFRGLPAENANGTTIRYTVDEQEVKYYQKDISGTTITNRLEDRQPENYTEIKGVKTWVEDGNVGLTTRPDSLKVKLFRDGDEIASVEITEKTGWSYSFGKQPLDDGYGNLYHYEVREEGVPGYLCRVNGFDLINKLLRPNNPDTGTTNRTNSRIQPTGGLTAFRNMNTGDLELVDDLFGYNTPLWGGLLGTGDETPIYPYIFGGVGLLAVIALVIFGRKRKKGSK